MTKEEFLEALAETKDWGWTIQEGRDIRAPRNGDPYNPLCCPLIAVAYARFELSLQVHETLTAGEWLNLDGELRESIVFAADLCRDFDGKDMWDADMREALKEAVGLVEKV